MAHHAADTTSHYGLMAEFESAQALLDAAPIPDPVVERARAPRALVGEIPSPLAPPSGCVFHTRCPMASAECRAEIPPLREVRPGQFAACIKV